MLRIHAEDSSFTYVVDIYVQISKILKYRLQAALANTSH